MSTINKFEFRSLPCGHEVLEPFIDKQTVEIQLANIIRLIMTIS